MYTITKRIEFDAAHRVLGHESKCRFIHGHRYRAEITVESQDLDKVGRVIDFSVIKSQIKGWIDENWDHNIILSPQDPLLRLMLDVTIGDARLANFIKGEVFQGRRPFIMPEGMNTTVECMAQYLCGVARMLMPDGVEVVNVRLYESPNGWADHPGE